MYPFFYLKDPENNFLKPNTHANVLQYRFLIIILHFKVRYPQKLKTLFSHN